MKEIWNYIKLIFSSSDEASCKRIMGVIILLTELVRVNFMTKVDSSVESLHLTLIYCGAGLVGLGVLEHLKKL